MVIASSISGLPIYAPSAAFAPTNSAEVSAIASAYQVVSATATQLYAGTAYVTSINEAPVSAARAGNAANASLSNSAWYDGTGRLISALPDSAAVSAIASSYVESGVSSKQDTLSFAYNTADQISSINGSALGGMDEAAVSGIASAYAESAASSKADSSALSSYALSADVSGTVDLVSTQSANWGGSALALSAGPGVKFEKSGNVLVASTDETLLWSGAASSACTLNESISSFNSIKLTLSDLNGKCTDVILSPTTASAWPTNIPSHGPNGAGITLYWVEYGSNNLTVSKAKSMTTLFTSTAASWEGNTGTALNNAITKVYGINRTAEA